MPGVVAERKIDKARSGDVHLGHQRIGWQRGDQRGGQIARLGASQSGQLHRHVAGEVAVLAGLGALDLDRRKFADAGERTVVLGQSGHGAFNQLAQLLFQGGGLAVQDDKAV